MQQLQTAYEFVELTCHDARTSRQDPRIHFRAGSIFEQFGAWWVFLAQTGSGESVRRGPYRTREAAEQALDACADLLPARTRQ